MGPESTVWSVSGSVVKSDDMAVTADGWASITTPVLGSALCAEAETEMDTSRGLRGGVIVPVTSAVLTVTTAPAEGV